MFTRRKTRTTHSTAYTGVNHTAPPSNQPNHNAMAAALTIGNSMKNDISRSGSVRAPSFANYKKAAPIKRSPSVTHAFSDFASHAGAERSGFAVSAADDSSSYNNHETVGDLKLSHAQPKQKMVKKYIPTPNGIKVIEVPAANMEKELARHNSIRSSGNMSRSQSLTSVRAQRRPGSRMSSLVKPSPLHRVAEEPKAQSSLTSRSLEYEQLQRQIEEEERLQRDIELKRQQYERLKQKRLHDEQELRRLQNPTDQSSNISIPESQIPKPVLGDLYTVDTDDTHTGFTNTHSETTSFTSDYTANGLVRKETIDELIDELPETSIDPSGILVDELETKEIDEVVHDSSIDPSKLVVDELEGKSVDKSVDKSPAAVISDLSAHGADTTIGDASIDVSRINLDELDEKTFDNFNPDETKDNYDDSFHTLGPDHVEDEYGIEEVEDDEPTPNLASQLRPKFDNIPSIIEDDKQDLLDSLKIPASVIRDGSSASSVASSNYDSSPSRAKKPMKSAMKNSSSSYTLQNSQKGNAAHEAYLSLTTAENTRLNSKLSAPQLNDINNAALSQSHHYPSTSSLNKRMSQTLRKPPPVTGNGFQKSMRPQSMQGEPKPQDNAVGSRMSNRSLRDRSSVYVAPINPHPALQPGYQSPSKARAAELYAKANNRPHSTFKPRERASSYSKGAEGQNQLVSAENGVAEKPKAKPVPKTQYRTTLRDLTREHTEPNGHDAHAESRQPTTQSARKSRFIDSDDESPHVPSNIPPPRAKNTNTIPQNFTPSKAPELLTLRQSEAPRHQPAEILTLRSDKKTQEAKPKEKKKIGRLRKLFGGKN